MQAQVWAVFADLSKAFDCLPHPLLLAKLYYYGASKESTNLLASYLCDRKQRVKVASEFSSWKTIKKGVPQGSILGPVIFNCFMNDIFSDITSKNSTLFNYADDNSVGVKGRSKKSVQDILQLESKNIVNWCSRNQMEANPNKFQVIYSHDSDSEPFTNNINGSLIKGEPHVKLLGINIDTKLNFNYHISVICKRAAQQLNALKRLSAFLNTNSRLLLYKYFIFSHFNYCPAVWHNCGSGNAARLERVQLRALRCMFFTLVVLLRFVYNDNVSSYANLLAKANLPTLELGRLRKIAIEVYKSVKGVSPTYICDMSKIKNTNYNLRNSSLLVKNHQRTKAFGLNSFSYTASHIWNLLPQQLRPKSKGILKTGKDMGGTQVQM